MNAKQEAFLHAYLRTFNATQAAKEAGYSAKTAYSYGHDLLKNPEIVARVREELEHRAMAAQEVLARLAAQARADVSDLIDPATLTLDWKRAQESGATHLIKKIKQTIITGDEKQTEIFEFELYDAQSALVHIGKHLGLFKERLDITSDDDKLGLTINIGKLNSSE